MNAQRAFHALTTFLLAVRGTHLRAIVVPVADAFLEGKPCANGLARSRQALLVRHTRGIQWQLVQTGVVGTADLRSATILVRQTFHTLPDIRNLRGLAVPGQAIPVVDTGLSIFLLLHAGAIRGARIIGRAVLLCHARRGTDILGRAKQTQGTIIEGEAFHACSNLRIASGFAFTGAVSIGLAFAETEYGPHLLTIPRVALGIRTADISSLALAFTQIGLPIASRCIGAVRIFPALIVRFAFLTQPVFRISEQARANFALDALEHTRSGRTSQVLEITDLPFLVRIAHRRAAGLAHCIWGDAAPTNFAELTVLTVRLGIARGAQSRFFIARLSALVIGAACAFPEGPKRTIQAPA